MEKMIAKYANKRIKTHGIKQIILKIRDKSTSACVLFHIKCVTLWLLLLFDMIKSLHIENYALISKLDIELHDGFSVITGETGAGKSIILGAIGLLKGQRAETRSIKSGERRCVVEAVFDVSRYALQPFFDDNDLDFDGTECVVRRELTATGKSRAFINDTPVSAGLLKELGDQLLDVHSQHQNLLLNKEGFQLSVLDLLSGDSDLLSRYQVVYAGYRHALQALDEAIAASQRSQEDEDYWRFQYNQLDEARLDSDDEQEELERESELLEHAEEIRSELFVAQSVIDGDEQPGGGDNILSQLKHALSSLSGISDKYAPAGELSERIESCYIELKDVAGEIESGIDSVESNPERLQQVEERLNQIYTLERKHNVDSIAALKAIRDDYCQKLDAIDNSEEHINELRKQADKLYADASALASELTACRTAAAREVENRMVGLLQELGMANVRFEICVSSDLSQLSATGADHVAYLFSANKNGALQDVSKVASGGEIARVMLSLKSLIASAVKLPTIIFDEIDTGVSGRIAEKMAKIMQSMGEGGRQVISITHLPQIAALGSSHYKVYKEDDDDATHTHIVELGSEERVEEIAHMLSGAELTKAAIENARTLLNSF